MSTPAIIWIILAVMSGLLCAAKHGEPRGNYDIGEFMLGALLAVGLLYWGGFFS